MFKIYIKDFNRNGAIVKTETLVQEIPADSEGELKLINPSCKNEMGNSETLDFSIEPGTKFYDAFLQMKTYMRIEYDGDTIFYGRVLTIDNNTFHRTRKIRLEGPLAFLLDSPVEGLEEKKRPKISTYQYLKDLINNHNSYIENEPNKRFMLGYVPGNYGSISAAQRIKNDKRKFGEDSWTDTKSAIEDLRSHYGGFLRTRAAGKIGDGIYLDWMNHYFNPNQISQTVEVGKNILDLSDITEINNVFTAIVPIGRHSVSTTSSGTAGTGSSKQENLYLDNKVVKVPYILTYYKATEKDHKDLDSGYHKYEYYRDAIKNYGMIVKTVSFQDAETKEKLLKDACEWIKNNYQGGVTKFTIKAIDMHQVGDKKVSKIMIGDRVKIRYPVADESGKFTMRETVQTCLSITFDLYHPENNSYTFGIPANMLTKTYGINKTGSVNSGATTPKSTTPTIGNPPDKDWLDVVGGWLMRHKLYYTGSKPYVDTDENNERMSGDYLYSPSRGLLVKANVNANGHIMGGNLVNFRDEGRVFDESTIEAYKVCEYVQLVYGIDLRTCLEVEAPDITTDENGNISFWQKVTDGITGHQEKIKSFFIRFREKLSTHLLDVKSADGNNIYSYMDSDGNWHYYYTDPTTGERVETNVRDLNISAIDSENKIGWVVQEDGNGNYDVNPESFPGQMTLAIENYAGGELVTARVSGELMYLGNYKTQSYTAVSLKHMDQICGDFEYVPDPDDNSINYIKIKSGGGMRVWHAEKDPITGKYIKDSQGVLKSAEFGIYDENTLTGGMITKHLADGSVVTKISGDIVDISANQVKAGNSFVNLERWLNSHGESIDDVSGLLTEKIIAYEGEFHTIKNDYLLTSSLEAEFGKLTNVMFNNGGTITMGGEWFCSPAFDKITLPAGKVYFTSTAGEHQSATTFTSMPSDFLKEIRVVAVNSYQYKLQYKKHGDSTDASTGWHDIPDSTFSGASRLSGSWSGGIFTVRNDPDNQKAVTVPPGTLSTTALHFAAKNNPTVNTTTKMISQVYKVQWRDLAAEAARPGMGAQYSDTGFEDTITVDASSIYTFAHGEGFRKALNDKGVTVSGTTISWPDLKLATSGSVTVSGKTVTQTVTVQYRDAIAEGAGQPAPYYTNSSISGTVTISATDVYDNGVNSGYSSASGKVKVNGYSSVNTSHSIDPGGSCSITVPYYDASSGNPKSTLTHVVTASTSGVRNTPHYNAIGDLNFLRAPDGTVQKLTMSYSYQGRTYTTGSHWWFYENSSFGSSYSGRLYTYYS